MCRIDDEVRYFSDGMSGPVQRNPIAHNSTRKGRCDEETTKNVSNTEIGLGKKKKQRDVFLTTD